MILRRPLTMADQQNATINLSVDRSNLYREELFTDLKVCTIRKLTPVKSDGTADKTRKNIYVGQTHLVSPNGPIPVQNVVKAKDLQQAFKKFPEAMKAAMEQMIEEAKKIQQQEESRIIVPGR
jgi:hypothetical protein